MQELTFKECFVIHAATAAATYLNQLTVFVNKC